MKVLDYGLIAVAEELPHVANSAINSGESTETTVNIQDEDVCIAALDKHVKEALKGLDKTEAKLKAVAKNVTNFRHEIIKDFMSSHMTNKRRYCPVCNAPAREVRSEHNSRLFLKALSAREANKWAKARVVECHMARQSAPTINGMKDDDSSKLLVKINVIEGLG